MSGFYIAQKNKDGNGWTSHELGLKPVFYALCK